MNRTFLCVETTEFFSRELQRVAAAEGDRLLVISSVPAEGLDSVRLNVWDDPVELAAEIRRLCADRPVVAAVTDREVFTEATAALGAALGVARNPASAIAAARDKARMKQAWQAAGVNTAQGRFYRSRRDLEPEQVDYPVIVKPSLGFASCGVRRVDSPAELLEQVSKIGLLNATVVAKGASTPAGFLVEECLDGPEYAVDTVWFEGQPVGSCLLSRGRPELSTGPYYPDRLYLLDQSLPAERRQLILDLAHRAVRALGIGFGPSHTEVRFRGDTPYVLETAARPGGSGLFYRMLRTACGVDLIRAMYLSQVCEDRDEFELRLGPIPEAGWDRDTSYFLYNLPYRGSGIISEIVGMDRLAGRPEVLACLLLKRPGNHLAADGDLNPDYFCHILARHVSTPDGPSLEAQLACYDGLVEIRF